MDEGLVSDVEAPFLCIISVERFQRLDLWEKAQECANRCG